MTEDREQELRKEAETGRRYKIAMEVLGDILGSARSKGIESIESGKLNDEELRATAQSLCMIKIFRALCESAIQSCSN